jgi:hypothetical protein
MVRGASSHCGAGKAAPAAPNLSSPVVLRSPALGWRWRGVSGVLARPMKRRKGGEKMGVRRGSAHLKGSVGGREWRGRGSSQGATL